MSAAFIPLGTAVTQRITTHNPTTGAAENASAAPQYSVYEDTTATAIVSVTCVTVTGQTGAYTATYTVSAANGFEAGKFYNGEAVATVTSITGKKVYQTFMCQTTAVTAGVANAHVAGVTVTTMTAGVTVTAIVTGIVNVSAVATALFQALGIMDMGTAAAIASNSISLRSGHGISSAESVLVYLTGGTDAVGKSRLCSYSGSGDVFTPDPNWDAAGESLPSGTITYVVFPAPPSPTSSVPAVNLTQVNGSAAVSTTAHLGVKVVSFVTGAATSSTFATGALAASTVLNATVSNTVTVGAVSVSAITAGVTVTSIGSSAVADIQSGLALATALSSVANAVATQVAQATALTSVANAVATQVAQATALATLSGVVALSTQVDALETGVIVSNISAITSGLATTAGVSAAVAGVAVTVIGTSTLAATNLGKSAESLLYGTVTTGGSTTSIPTSAFSVTCSTTGQLQGRIVIFDADTTTAGLRGCATDITANTASATPTLTVTALPATPASGDTFVVV